MRSSPRSSSSNLPEGFGGAAQMRAGPSISSARVLYRVGT